MYIVTVFLGLGQAIVLNTGTALISEVIGTRGSSGSFVFGFYGFAERTIMGLVLYLVLDSEYMKDKEMKPIYLRYVTSLLPAVSAFAAWFFIMFGEAKDYDMQDEEEEIDVADATYKKLINEYAG